MRYAKRKFTLKCKNPSEFSTCEPYEVFLSRGKYLFECVGASGASGNDIYKGYGAKVSGIITLKKETSLYVYVGGTGSSYAVGEVSYGGYNGGGNGGIGFFNTGKGTYFYSGFGGGGATDIRTIKGPWNDSVSLDSRIIVAAGGGAGSFDNLKAKGGDGGSLEGFPSKDGNGNIVLGANQTHGFAKGAGESAQNKEVYGNCGAEGNSGAGGGWYGGFASKLTGDYSDSGAGGGSSFISGHEGLEIINYFKFDFTHMESGNVTHNIGDGYAIITQLSRCTKACRMNTLPLTYLITFVLS